MDQAPSPSPPPRILRSLFRSPIPTCWKASLTNRVDFAAQNYGMLAKPNMKDLHDKYPASFSPQPFAILGFFGPQQIIQLLWLRELWRSESQVEKGTLRYAPWYALGNSCIAAWMLFWVRLSPESKPRCSGKLTWQNSDNLKGAFVPVAINTLTQLYYVFALRNSSTPTYQSKLTNIVNITFAGM